MSTPDEQATDPYLWLEDVTGERALAWVRERNERTRTELAAEDAFAGLESELLDVLDTDTRIPYVRRRGAHLYNFWRDAAHPRGVWRRTTLDSYRTDTPEWDVLVDVDALAAAESENWVWKGTQVLREPRTDPQRGGPEYRHVLVSLSRGGADAAVVREFDLVTRSFVDPADGGFHLPEAKTDIDWIDVDTVFVGTDFGEGSLTASGYPRIAKRWRRGTDVADATTVFEGKPEDVAISAWHDNTPGFERSFVDRAVDFYNSERSLLAPDGTLVRIDTPEDARVSVHRSWLLVFTRSAWTVGGTEYPAGTLLAADFGEYLDGVRELTAVFEPDAHTSLEDHAWTADHLILVTLADVQTQLWVLEPGSWRRRPFDGLPGNSTVDVLGTDPEHSNEIFLSASGFTRPSTLLHGYVGEGAMSILKQAPAFFDADGLTVRQFFATSRDGTQIPYFVVRQGGTGAGPTLLYGYGGFEISLTPSYSGVLGRGWLQRGGTYVVANIRGGGEYGPEWHTQVLRAGRHKVHEDFAAVARDLVDREITTAAQLGAQGGSNGGLLMGIMLTRYPELFGAIVCQVPLLDMRRYHLLLAGASWVAEYGDPDDPDEWAYLSEYSPYQRVQADADYPPVLLTTSTRDDRVHPGHARKTAARLEEQGHSVRYYENIEGGHGGAADNAQQAFKSALAYTFLWRELSDGPLRSAGRTS